jgi:hypothetical protein
VACAVVVVVEAELCTGEAEAAATGAGDVEGAVEAAGLDDSEAAVVSAVSSGCSSGVSVTGSSVSGVRDSDTMGVSVGSTVSTAAVGEVVGVVSAPPQAESRDRDRAAVRASVIKRWFIQTNSFFFSMREGQTML